MIRRTRILAAITVVALIVLAVPQGASAGKPSFSVAAAQNQKALTPPTEVTLLADGLQGTVGGTIGPDGALYVAEGALGQITRIDPSNGSASTFASGLPLREIPLGGAIDVAFVGTTMYVLVTLVGPDVGGDSVVGIYEMDESGDFTVFADLGAWSVEHPPPTQFDVPSGLQFALQPVADGFLVTDGHHNRVLHVSSAGEVTQQIQFENIVPTGLAVTHGTVFLSQAGPVPHVPATGKVVSFPLNAPRPHAHDVASGFSLLVDVESGPDGALYALSQGDSPGDVPPASPAKPDSGRLLLVNRNGSFSVLVDKLDLPTSLDFVGDTAFITTLNGEVWKITNVSKFLKP
jgi:sugar lactone lactonase YvrE